MSQKAPHAWEELRRSPIEGVTVEVCVRFGCGWWLIRAKGSIRGYRAGFNGTEASASRRRVPACPYWKGKQR